jgi:hypothetical protein
MTLSLRAYAKHRKEAGLPGSTLRAIQVARDAGRLAGALTRDGKIRSAKVADAAWAASTHAERAPRTGRTAPPPESAPTEELPPDVWPIAVSRARREQALARIAEIELAELEDAFVPAEEAREVLFSKFTIVKTRLLAVPSKLAQRLPPAQRDRKLLELVEDLIREALEELAREQDEEDGEDEEDEDEEDEA